MADKLPKDISAIRATAPEPDESRKLHDYDPEVWQRIIEDAPLYASPAVHLDVEEDEEDSDPRFLSSGVQWIPALAHGGQISGPRLLVVHSAESPLAPGYAVSIAKNWFGTAAAGTSAHYIVDPVASVQMVHTYTVAYNVGPAGNPFTLGYEQAGYAKFTRAQWLTPDGLAQMKRLASAMAEDFAFYGIPVRRASLDDIRRARVDVNFKAGYCHHADITAAIAGTTHKDPGLYYPDDKLVATVNAILYPPAPVPSIKSVLLNGTAPVLQAGMKDPIAFKGGSYVARVQALLRLPVTGVYDATTVAKVKSENMRLLKRTTDGRTVDGLFWERLYGIQG